MNDAIRTIITMSLTGGALTILLLLVKPLIRGRLPMSAQYYLWFVVVAALLIPVSKLMTLPVDVVPPISKTVDQYVITSEEAFMDSLKIPTVYDSEALALRPDVNPVKVQQPTFATTAVSLFMFFYPICTAFVLLCYLMSYWWYLLKLRHNRTLTDITAPVRVYKSEFTATPMLIGVFRPVIILPLCEYADEQLRNVLAHELTHLRRRDILAKWLSVIAVSLHWFNPFAWLMRREIDRLCELSCDEAVISRYGTDEKQSYGDTLIAVVAERKTPKSLLSTTMIESKQALKERLGAIMKYKKHTRAAIILSVLLIIVAVGTAMAFGAGSGLDLPESQEQESASAGIGQSVTSNEVTVTVESVENDDYTVFIKLNVEVPEGVVLDKENYFFQEYYLSRADAMQSDADILGAGAAFFFLDDKDGKSNTISINLRLSVTVVPGGNFSYNDGEMRTLKLVDFCTWSDEGEVLIYEGSWDFDFVCSSNYSAGIDLISEPVYCQGERMSGSYEDVWLNSFELSTFGATGTYNFLNANSAPEALNFSAEVVIKDGSVIPLNPGSGTVGSFSFRVDEPIPINDADFVRLNGGVILPIYSTKGSSPTLDKIPSDYSLEQAKTDGCVVYEDGNIAAGQAVWDDFVQKCESGQNASVRLGFYYTLQKEHISDELYEQEKDNYPMLFFQDLSYNGKEFELLEIDDDSSIIRNSKYNYMNCYTGSPKSSSAIFSSYTYYVLVDDESVTWEQIERGMASSKFGDYIDHRQVYRKLVLK